MEIKEFIEANKEKMTEVLAKMISYPTVEDLTDPDYPFGKANAECLDYVLELCNEWGFKTKNLDYYAGYAEIGSGDKVIGTAGHLDVVPAGNGWDSDPFILRIEDGKAYGRGTSDNKGPTVSALFALKYFVDSRYPLDKRLRIVFGCNEESGMQCIHRYVEKEGHFDLGFIPDGPFPCCFGEKGIIHFQIRTPNKLFKAAKGGVATNVVPDYCELVLPADDLDTEKMIEYFAVSPISEYVINEADGDITLEVHGKAAHGSMPEEGINAVAHALEALIAGGVKDEALLEYHEKINTEIHGEGCGIHITDQYGELTFNVGMIGIENDELFINVDIRCPFTTENNVVTDELKDKFRNWTLEINNNSTGLYMPEDSSFVVMLTETYRQVSGDLESKPVSMGGGTYARHIRNTLAYGPSTSFLTNIHDANEFTAIEDLAVNCEIYLRTLLKMLEL